MKTDRLETEPEILYDRIARMLTEHGLKNCTMDLVSAGLGMSKRTLYEIFESKEVMIDTIVNHISGKVRQVHAEIFKTSANMMEAMVREVLATLRFMQSVSPDFLRDMHRLPFIKENQKRLTDSHIRSLSAIVERGVSEGVFRADTDYQVVIRLLLLQYESLKCLPGFFSEEITLPYAYHCISISFLRSIASPGGMQILDRLTTELSEQTTLSSATDGGSEYTHQ